MRCRNLPRAALALFVLVAPLAGAAPEDARRDLGARLAVVAPNVPAAELALGSAAFDPQLREAIAANASAAAPVIEAGRKLWNRKFADGRSIAACFPNGGKRVAASYPQFDARVRRVVTLEMAINQCLKSHGEALYEPTDPATMGLVVAYVRSLSAGQKVAVRVTAPALERFEQGRRLYFTRLGQRNFACASCHVQGVGRIYAGAALSAPLGHAVAHPVVRGDAPLTLQSRMRECLEIMGAAPFQAGSEELNNIEYYLTYLANGSALKPNAWRPPAQPR